MLIGIVSAQLHDVLASGANVWIRKGDRLSGYSSPLEGMCPPQSAMPSTNVNSEGASYESMDQQFVVDATGLTCTARVWKPTSDADWMAPDSNLDSHITLLHLPKTTLKSNISSNFHLDGNSTDSDYWYRASMSLPSASPMSFVRALPGTIYISKSTNSNLHCNHADTVPPLQKDDDKQGRSKYTSSSYFSPAEEDKNGVYRYCCRGGYWSPAWGRKHEKAAILRSCSDFDHYASMHLHHGKKNTAFSLSTTNKSTRKVNGNTTLGIKDTSYREVVIDSNHNPMAVDCIVRMLRAKEDFAQEVIKNRLIITERNSEHNSKVIVAIELCPYLFIKRLKITDSGEIQHTEYLGSFRSETNTTASNQPTAILDVKNVDYEADKFNTIVIHSFINPHSGFKTVVEYLCPTLKQSKGDGIEDTHSAIMTKLDGNEFTIIFESMRLLHLRIIHRLGCAP